MTPEAEKILSEIYMKEQHTINPMADQTAELYNELIDERHAEKAKDILADADLLDEALGEYMAGNPKQWKEWVALMLCEGQMRRPSSFKAFCEVAADEYAALLIVREES